MEAEKAFAQDRREARVAALHHLRWQLCLIPDDLIAFEEKDEPLETDDLDKKGAIFASTVKVELVYQNRKAPN
jgi:hypothetical protein